LVHEYTNIDAAIWPVAVAIPAARRADMPASRFVSADAATPRQLRRRAAHALASLNAENQREQGEHLMGAQSTWPFGPAERRQSGAGGSLHERESPDQTQEDQEPAYPAIAEMARLLRDIRGNMLTAGAVLASITIGIAFEARFAARASQSGVPRVIDIGLLLGLIVCWLRALVLLALAGRPVLNRLSELRWRTGAPLDPRPHWVKLPPVGADPDVWTWSRAHVLLGAARLARYRACLAEKWIYITAGYFLVWTAVIIIGR
jgi:hypothetical protein